MAEIIILSGHSNFNTGGVGTHLRVLNDELINQKIDHKVSLGKHKVFSLYSLIAKKMLPRSAYFHFNVQVSGLKNSLKNYVKDNTKVVDCHDFSAVVAAVKLKEENNYKYKIIYTVHAPFYEQYGLMKNEYPQQELIKLKKAELDYLKKCDGFVCVDDKQKEIIEKKLGCTINNIVLPNAVDVGFLETIKKNSNAEKYIIISRHLYKKCGVHVGIEAFSKAKINKDIKLVIVGMGDEYENLLNLTKKLGVENRVVFKGRLIYEESVKYTANALISLIPSIPLGDYVEATSLSMLEGMALGVPVIASNIGGLKQVLENSDAGILVEPNDSEALAKKIEILVENSDLRNHLSHQSKILVNNHYSSTAWLKKRLEFYNR
ncbi:TPA: glycosyltransferase family 4 protein [Acinetobacter baumannii]